MAKEKVLAHLRVHFADGTEQVIDIVNETFTIGRSGECNLTLTDVKVSRHHVRLLFEDDRLSLIDLKSSNGTYMDDIKLNPNQPYALAYGQPFIIGPYTLQLETVITSSPTQQSDDNQPDPQTVAVKSAEALPSGEDIPPSETAQMPAVRIGAVPRPKSPSPPTTPPPSGPPSASGQDGTPQKDNKLGLSATQSRYLQFLPPIYEQHPFLGIFLLAFEGVLTPIEQTVDNFDLYLDPSTTPAFFLSQLANWLAMSLDEKWPLEKQRAVLSEAAELYRRRGTRWSLSRYLEIYTELTSQNVQIVEPEDQPHLFSVVLRTWKGKSIDRVTVERIIEASKPAHTVYTLEIFEERE